MSRHLVVLREPVEARNVLDRLWHWLKPRLMSGHLVELSVSAPKRTLPQNSLLHATLTDIARRREWAGRRIGVEEWKRLFTAAWLRARGEQVVLLPALDGHGYDVVFRRTSELNKAEMAELIDYINAWDALHDEEDMGREDVQRPVGALQDRRPDGLRRLPDREAPRLAAVAQRADLQHREGDAPACAG